MSGLAGLRLAELLLARAGGESIVTQPVAEQRELLIGRLAQAPQRRLLGALALGLTGALVAGRGFGCALHCGG